MENQIIECVPNFSEGRDHAKIAQITQAINEVEGVKVLHVDMGFDANRTVISFAGRPEGVEEAAFQAMRVAAEVIDMRQQKGTHPRLGATDVMPIIPVSQVEISEVIALSYRLSERVARELSIPVFNYEHSAKRKQRQRLEVIRRGEYEGLEQKMSHPDWTPDYGRMFNAKAGASIIGARAFLLAYNVNLKSPDLGLAKRIAALIRESGILVNGIRKRGCFKGVKAIGWDVPEYGMVQVSTNITAIEQIGLHDVFEQVKVLAKTAGVEVSSSELIGLIPLKCLLASGAFYAPHLVAESELLEEAIAQLGLGFNTPFDPQERIIDYLL